MSNFTSFLGGIAVSVALATSALAAGVDVNASSTGLAMQGYDPVAYFTDGAPTKGDYQLTAVYNDATYWFSSEDNKAAFEANPEAYAPAYGGYCAFGTAMGFKFDGDPTLWKIVDEKLYLNLSPSIQERWATNIPGFIADADSKWGDIADVEPAVLLEQ
ncbi:YHS domain-containing (seleno)protein [uncultured Pelagimonas sp.]|uniref:YHS domain-containing (seleno)protein n=1 Tax=uncultured Pelagimonas sp. TaxID=1618102 RepID=UPI0026195858|nr:YHS domain-containing (seleno)protein [uncultured Pelagimonas sp.]